MPAELLLIFGKMGEDKRKLGGGRRDLLIVGIQEDRSVRWLKLESLEWNFKDTFNRDNIDAFT